MTVILLVASHLLVASLAIVAYVAVKRWQFYALMERVKSVTRSAEGYRSKHEILFTRKELEAINSLNTLLALQLSMGRIGQHVDSVEGAVERASLWHDVDSCVHGHE